MPAYRARGPPRVQRHGDPLHHGRRPADRQPWPPIRCGSYQVHDSRLVYRRILAAGIDRRRRQEWWFMGDFQQGLRLHGELAHHRDPGPDNSEAEFSQDIVVRFKASERGAAAVINPRYVVMSTS